MTSVVVLIAAPGSGAISAEVVAALRGYGAENFQWLSPGDAAEADFFPRLAEFLVDVRDLPVDVAVVSSENRRKRLLVADMDSTMIHQECIDELGVVAGFGEPIKDITARAMRGELDFAGALRARVALLKGLDESVIAKVIRDRITFVPGGKTLIATMKANGAYTALLSGGFTAFTAHVAGVLGFDEHRANTLLTADGRLTGTVTEPVLGQEAKRQSLLEIAALRGLDTADAIAVGDGANDVAMLMEAGLGVALHAKPHVQESSMLRINHADLTALLYLQGYRKDQFVNA